MSIPTPTEPYVPRLPHELWLLVFRFATSASIHTSASYEPFQSCHDTIAALSDAALRDKCTLTLVCKQWRALATDFLYEDIRIGRGISALRAAFSEYPPTPADGIHTPRSPRHRVRRAVLPYAHTATPTHHAPPALALLALLPQLEVLVRPPTHHRYHHHPYHPHHYAHRTSTNTAITAEPTPRFEFPISAPALPTLRSLEWAHDLTGAAARSGGINALDAVLHAAPALHELVLVGPMPLNALRQHRLRLPALRTLRLHAGAAECPLIVRQTTYWALPALERVVVKGAAAAGALEALWEAFGGLVRVLEMELGAAGCGAGWGCGGGVLMADVGRIVSACPALEELNVRVGLEDLNNLNQDGNLDSQDAADGGDSEPRTWACAHDTLQRVGICVVVREWTAKTWMAVANYVVQFGKGCPALRCVVLYVRDVQVAPQDAEFRALRETLSSSGRQLILRSVLV